MHDPEERGYALGVIDTACSLKELLKVDELRVVLLARKPSGVLVGGLARNPELTVRFTETFRK